MPCLNFGPVQRIRRKGERRKEEDREGREKLKKINTIMPPADYYLVNIKSFSWKAHIWNYKLAW